MLGAAAAAVALEPRGAVEPQVDDGLVGQQRGLDVPARAAQRQRGEAPGQLAAGGEIAARRVERDADLEPPVMHCRFLLRKAEAVGAHLIRRSCETVELKRARQLGRVNSVVATLEFMGC